MTGAHVPTEQETAIYQALTGGDHDTIDQMEQDAEEAGPEAAEQFDVDYEHAHAHYQTDHEAPEAEREQNTAADVHAENQEATT